MSLMPKVDKSLWGKFKEKLSYLKKHPKTPEEEEKSMANCSAVLTEQDNMAIDSLATTQRQKAEEQNTVMIKFENLETAGTPMEIADTVYGGGGGGDQPLGQNCTCCRRCSHRSRVNVERLKHSLCEARVRNGWLLDRQRDLEIENGRLMKTWCDSEARLHESEACHLRESRASQREFESRLRELEARDVASEYSKSRLVARLQESDMENYRLRAELAESVDRQKQQDVERSELVDQRKRQNVELSVQVAEDRAVLLSTITDLQTALLSCANLQTVAERLAVLQTNLSNLGDGDDL